MSSVTNVAQQKYLKILRCYPQSIFSIGDLCFQWIFYFHQVIKTRMVRRQILAMSNLLFACLHIQKSVFHVLLLL